MKIQLTASLSGPARAWDVGDEYECSESEGRRLIEAGFAVPIIEQKVERAIRRSAAKEKRG